MSKLLSETLQKGLTTELQAILFFVDKGFLVSIPYGNAGRYDLLVDNGQKIYRIQCKTAHKNENNSYTINVSNSRMCSNGNVVKHYTKDQVDYIMTFIEQQAVFIPVEAIENSRSKIFRAELPKYGAKSNCNLIKDFTYDKFFDN